MNILGISCFYHDAAACLLVDGKVVAASAEERFTRKKHDSAFPTEAVSYALLKAKLSMSEIDYVVFYEKPLLKFERLIMSYGETFPASLASFLKSMPVWMEKKAKMRAHMRDCLHYGGKILFAKHHLSHAASAFFQSGFDSAALLTVDGVGEWTTTALGRASGTDIRLSKEITFPHSLGLLYTAFTYYLGFRVNSGEYKVMGLAPNGTPKYKDLILSHLIDVKPDGSFRLNMKYFAYHYGLKMIRPAFEALFGRKTRRPESALEPFHSDIAASIQAVTNEIMLRLAVSLHDETGEENLCLAGGVAMNCVSNGIVARKGPFKRVFVQPECGDAGGALGAALFCYHGLLKQKAVDPFSMPYFGPSFSDEEIVNYLTSMELEFERADDETLVREVAEAVDAGKIVGWFQGRSEFGPRALGNRSILADARRSDMKDILNAKIKLREGFRPFAPVVLEEKSADWFERDLPSPHMTFVVPVREEKKARIPSVTHVDGSARIQTVSAGQNPLLHKLLRAFDERTGVPVMINTSFNVRGEPIVNTPEEAYACFIRTGIDILVMGNCMVKHKSRAHVASLALREVALD